MSRPWITKKVNSDQFIVQQRQSMNIHNMPVFFILGLMRPIVVQDTLPLDFLSQFLWDISPKSLTPMLTLTDRTVL